MKLSSYSVISINLHHLPIVSVYGSAKFGDGKWFSFIYKYSTIADAVSLTLHTDVVRKWRTHYGLINSPKREKILVDELMKNVVVEDAMRFGLKQ